MVLGTRKVREEVSHNQFASLSLSSQLPTNIESALGYAPLSHVPRRPSSHARAIRRSTAIAFCTVSASSTPSCAKASWRWISTSSTSLARFSSCFNGAAPPSPPSHAKARLRRSFLGAAPYSVSLACKVCQIWTPAFSTSLVCKSEPGWIFSTFRCRYHVFHLPRMQRRARGRFYTVFQCGQRHLPRMQQPAGGGFYMAF